MLTVPEGAESTRPTWVSVRGEGADGAAFGHTVVDVKANARAVVVLEHTGPVKGLGRSWRLVRGSAWRVLGILLLTYLIVGVASTILRLPFSLLAGLGTLAQTPTATALLASVAISSVGVIVATAVTRPVTTGVTVLLYTDLRMRREGLDITLQAAASQPAAPAGTGAGVGGTGVGSTGVGRGVHFDVLVSDLDDAQQRVVALGGSYVERHVSPRPGPGGEQISWRVCRDPDGHPFCLVTR